MVLAIKWRDFGRYSIMFNRAVEQVGGFRSPLTVSGSPELLSLLYKRVVVPPVLRMVYQDK